MAKTNVRGTQIADGSSGVDLTVDVFGTLPVGNGGTGVANPTANRFLVGNGTSVVDLSKVVPSGTVVGTSDTQTLTAKTLTTPLLTQSATPSTPAAGFDALYSKSDDSLNLLGNDGIERTITSTHPVRVSSAGSLTLSGAQTIDGVSCVAGDRVLARHQGVFAGNAFDNGVWVVAAGAWSRAADGSTAAEMAGALFHVQEGTKFAGYAFRSTFLATDTLGTTSLALVAVNGVDHGNVFNAPLMNTRSAGASYYDDSSGAWRIWNGSAWDYTNGIVPLLSSEPAFPVEGMLWFDVSDNTAGVDTGWLNLSALTGMTMTFGQYRVYGDTVHVRGNFTITAGVTVTTNGGMTDQALTTVPSAYMPGDGAKGHHFLTFWVNSARIGHGYVSYVDGIVRLQAVDGWSVATNLAAGSTVQFSTTYLLG